MLQQSITLADRTDFVGKVGRLTAGPRHLRAITFKLILFLIFFFGLHAWRIFSRARDQIYLKELKLRLTYVLTPWCSVLLEQLTGLKLLRKFPAFHGTRRFITAHSQASATCPYPGPAQSSPYTHIPPLRDPYYPPIYA